MKQIALIIIITLYTLNIYGQNEDKFLAIYDIYYNTEVPVVKEGKLEIQKNQKQSLFVISPKDKNRKRAKREEDNSITLMDMTKKLRFVHFNSDKDSLYTTSRINRKDYIIKEKTPTIDWKLTNETKKIANFNVQKATANFRGRNYIAWYSTDYPIKFGPWKFHGLPGLIVEIFDETNRYHWILTSLGKTTDNSFAKVDTSIYKEISIKEYVDLRYNKKSNYLATKLPRNAKMLSFSKPVRNSIETKFEWEKEEETKQ
ncbi:GLPGLI family protein [Kordia sp. TARA_039_SRF]|nr:GLPGLI family protein [Kordia sp. TARA_039_SRF]